MTFDETGINAEIDEVDRLLMNSYRRTAHDYKRQHYPDTPLSTSEAIHAMNMGMVNGLVEKLRERETKEESSIQFTDTDTNITYALIYARVASHNASMQEQLKTQETLCRREIAKRKYQLLGIYRDIAAGNMLDRPELSRLYEAIEIKRQMHPFADIVVVTDEVSRIARDLETHWKIKARLEKELGCRIIFASSIFDDTLEAIQNIEHQHVMPDPFPIPDPI